MRFCFFFQLTKTPMESSKFQETHVQSGLETRGSLEPAGKRTMHSGCAPTLPPTQTSSGSCQRIEFARGRRQKRGRRNPGARKVDSGIIRGRMGESRNRNGGDSFPLPRFTPPSGPCPAAPQGLSSAGQLGSAVLSALPLSVAGRVIWWGWGWGPSWGPALTQPCFPLGEQF